MENNGIDLDKKLLQHFPGRVVRKDLTKLMKVGHNVPVHFHCILIFGLTIDSQ